jgi:chlorophyll synthase
MAIVFWGISIVPFYISWVFASQQMFPATAWNTEFINFVVGLIVIGPFVGGSTLLYNDFWDREVDKINRRKSDFPLPKGLIRRETILHASYAFMLLAVLFSLILPLIFTSMVILILILSITYSAMPVRFKSRPGFDLIVNAAGAGILCSFAGWVVVEPIAEYPFFWLMPMFFGVTALFIPTTIIDYDSDKKNGVNTITVLLGQRRSFYIGLTSIAVANVCIITMCLTNYLISFDFIYVALPIAVTQVFLYWYILRTQTFKNVFLTIISLSALLTLGNLLLLFYYTGFWPSV